MSCIAKPTPLKFAEKFNKISVYDYIEYQKQLEDTELLKEIITKLSLQNVLDLMKIGKSDIKLLNAFFTPKRNSERLIELSQIEFDDNESIDILEPTAGIGNIILALLKLDNSTNFHIDAIEYISNFYQLGEVIFDNCKNVSWFHQDLFQFKSNKKYDYIFINPPFNIRYNNKEVLDIDFLEYSYQFLKDGGKLCCIISSSVFSNNKKQYKSFKDKLNSDNVIVEEFDNFSLDETIIKEMTTKIKMLYIIITKTPNFTFF